MCRAHNNREHVLAKTKSAGGTALTMTSFNGHVDVVKALLEIDSSSVELVSQTNCNGFSVLMWASREGHIEVVKELLKVCQSTREQHHDVGE